MTRMIGARLVSSGGRARARARSASGCRAHYVVPHISTGDMLRGRGRRRAPSSAARPRSSWTPGELVPDDIMVGVVDERLDKRRHPQPRASSSTASPAPSARPRRWREITAHEPSTWSSTSRCRRRGAGAPGGPPGLQRLRHRTTRSRRRPGTARPATCAAATSSSATTTPRRPSAAGSTSTSRRPRRSIAWFASASCSSRSTASAIPTTVTARLIRAIDGQRAAG